EEALDLLEVTSAHARGQAARALGSLGRASDVSKLRKALRKETVSHVQYALQDSIQRLAREAPSEPQTEDDSSFLPASVRQQIYGKAVERVTGTLLHEIASPIGLARLSAKRELDEKWESSDTRRHLENISRI